MEKMSIAEQAAVRANMYKKIETLLRDGEGYDVEPFKGGMLVDLNNGCYAKINVAIADPEKFDIGKARKEYAEIMVNRQARAEAAAIRKAEKAKRARDKAEAAAERAVEFGA